MTTSDRPRISIDIWSDVVCPWCYIGKRRFERGLELARAEGDLGVEVDVTYHAYQLDPRAAPGASSSAFEAYSKKFGGPEPARRIIDHVTRTAAESGLDFRLDRARRANTLLAHRLIWFAGRPGSPVAQADVKERLLQAYFVDGIDIGDPERLADCAAEVGLDRDEVAAFLDSDDGLDEVNEDLRSAYDQGITAVPTYVLNGGWGVPGAQEPETFANVIRKLASKAVAAGGADPGP